MPQSLDPSTHVLVPQHTKLNEEEKEKLLQLYNISVEQLPKILKSDPSIQNLSAEEGDIIKIIRKSITMGRSEFYRVVIHG